MKKSIIKKFADFKKRHLLSNEIIRKMITEYANSEYDLAQTHFSKKYDISKSTFYKARDFAIICCLVDKTTCKKIKKKTLANYKANNPKNTSNRSNSNFTCLYDERENFLKTFSDDEIRDIAFKYAEGLSIKNIASAYDIGEFGIKLLLRKGIVSLIVDGDITKSIKYRVGNDLDKILNQREQNKQIILSYIEKEIECLNFQITYHDFYYKIIRETPIPIEILQAKLKDALKRKQQVLRY